MIFCWLVLQREKKVNKVLGEWQEMEIVSMKTT